MTTKLEVDLIVEAIAKGFDGLKKQVEGVGKAGENAGKGGVSNLRDGLSKLAIIAATAGTALVAAKKAFEFGEEGAKLQLLESQFDNLAKSIGTTSDSLQTKLSEASKGLVSDAELIAGAGQIISLGLADSEDGVVRLATAVSTLGLDMQQVILTFANNSTMRLDALGLSVEDVTQKARALDEQGFVGDSFDEAVLIALEEKMRLLGDASQENVGAYMRLRAEGENLSNTFKTLTSDGLTPYIGTLADVAEATNNYADFIIARDDALEAGIITLKESQDLSLQVLATTYESADAIDLITQKTIEYNEALSSGAQNVTDNYQAYGEALGMVSREIDTASIVSYQLGDAVTTNTNALHAHTDALGENMEVENRFINRTYAAEQSTLAFANSLFFAGGQAASGFVAGINAAEARMNSFTSGIGGKKKSPLLGRGGQEEIEEIERVAISSSNNIASVQEQNEQKIADLQRSNAEDIEDVRIENEENIAEVRESNAKKIHDAEMKLAEAQAKARKDFNTQVANDYLANLDRVLKGESKSNEDNLNEIFAEAASQGANLNDLMEGLVDAGIASGEEAGQALADTIREQGKSAIGQALAEGVLDPTLVDDALAELNRQIEAGEDIDLSKFGISEADLKKFMDAETFAFEQSKQQAQELAEIKKQAALDEIQAREEASQRMIAAQEEASQRMAEAVQQASEAMANAYATGAASANTSLETIPDEVTTTAVFEAESALDKTSKLKRSIDELSGLTTFSKHEHEYHTRYTTSGEPPPPGSGRGGVQAPRDATGEPPANGAGGGNQATNSSQTAGGGTNIYYQTIVSPNPQTTSSQVANAIGGRG